MEKDGASTAAALSNDWDGILLPNELPSPSHVVSLIGNCLFFGYLNRASFVQKRLEAMELINLR